MWQLTRSSAWRWPLSRAFTMAHSYHTSCTLAAPRSTALGRCAAPACSARRPSQEVRGVAKRLGEVRGEGRELELYLALPVSEAETDLLLSNPSDLLIWWKNNECRFPKLAKMAKQYLAAPASTAGVERVFSAAGRMHTDLRKSMKDSTVEHSLFASFNTL